MKTFKKEIAGRELIIETGKLAGQTNGAVTVQYGDTLLLATAVMSDRQREGINYFPLMVDYEERLYAAGKIKGSRFMKREGRPTDEAVLSGRMVDRILRPLFNGRIRNDIQVVITILSVDQENDADFCAIIGASMALAISDIPWNGPVGVVRVAKVDGTIIANPTYDQRDKSKFEIIVAGKADKINMVEAGAKEALEADIIEAFKFAEQYIKDLTDFQIEIVSQIGKTKKEVKLVQADKETEEAIRQFISTKAYDLNFNTPKAEIGMKREKFNKELKDFVVEKFGEEIMSVARIIEEEETDALMHKSILEDGKRPDGRKMDEVRAISSEVGLLPRTHGSGLFNRGATQALTVATLGAPGDEQTLDGMEENGTKRFMHHYSFPAYSVGEVAPNRGPGRREIGHGALAEKALCAMIPDKESFPYTIRLVSEILSSNGSSSMASVCGSSLSLMDAGVPIARPVAGIAMGLITGKNREYKVLTDIQGPEDHYGDMDFKIAGTEIGINAMQMDVKLEGITVAIIEETLVAARKARMYIISIMNNSIDKSREDLSQYAPRITTLLINPDKIRDVIGPGGKIINEIIVATDVAIDIEDDGLVLITGKNAEGAKKAEEWIKNLTREIVVGEIFQGKVVKIMDFGAFVELLPGKDGLVHISELAEGRVEKVGDVVKVGDAIKVKVKEIDSQGRINLTHKGL
ncbi:MAG: polyribonucleotide nucleotidyltransferase [Candidatus Pacebacteria bacterium]|nr:polyribonucleotide nucleotidyltransferase [Candidatus Paceibacterota bacterium]